QEFFCGWMMDICLWVVDGTRIQMRLKRRWLPLVRICRVDRVFDLLGGDFATNRLYITLYGLRNRGHRRLSTLSQAKDADRNFAAAAGSRSRAQQTLEGVACMPA